MVTLRNQAPSRIMLGHQQVQLKELQPGGDVKLHYVQIPNHITQFLNSD